MAAKEKINLLEVIPCRSEHITAEREGETIVLSFPRFKYPWMQRFLVPKGMSKELHVKLEEHGTAVWELIDGKRNVREIIEKLADHFQNEEGYESRVSCIGLSFSNAERWIYKTGDTSRINRNLYFTTEATEF